MLYCINKLIIRQMSRPWLIPQNQQPQPIVKIPLQFHFEPVQILSKQLTKLNSSYPYRIHYLGPRWQDSAILHKKFANKEGYKFNDKQINKSSNFFSESMGQNQFYKNQVYYRAFEGMNPTIDKSEQLCFDSRFESGNLDCVVKVGPEQYDLFLRIDSNTRGHLFWFYFQISNCKPGMVVKLNICNMSKSIELYEKGFKPFTSVKNSDDLFKSWNQDLCFEVVVNKKKLRYDFIYERTKVRKLLQLSFKYKFQGKQPVRFAYCVPYTYSQMIAEIGLLQEAYPSHIRMGSIGKSLTGVDIPYLTVSESNQQKQDRPVLVCIGRLHPGQTNGSHVLSGFLNFLCSSQQSAFLRKKIYTIIIPMLNPDGVILGNSRTGAIGKDLNRQFKNKNRCIFPQIYYLKQFCQKITDNCDIEMFLDFHGHSKKKNMFLFGPNYNITQPQYYRSRIMPRFLSQITPIFRYFGCDYSIPSNKSTTARAVMLQQLNIPYVYAIQTSIGQYYDYQYHKIFPFSLKKWFELGAETVKAIKQYFQSIQQFAQYTKSKANYDNQLQSPTKITTQAKQQKNNEKQKLVKSFINKQPSHSPDKNPRFVLKDVRLIKIIQQIKAVEQEKRASKRKQYQSDNDSDSQNGEDNLQGKKRAEFQQMVSQCIQTQKIKQKKDSQFEQSRYLKLKKDQSLKLKKKKQRAHAKQENNLMKELLRSINLNTTIGENDQIQNNGLPTKHVRSRDRSFNKSVECANKYSGRQSYIFSQEKQISRSQYDDVIASNTYFNDALPENLDKAKKNNINLRMFNFSKIIEKTSDRSIATTGRYGRNRARINLKQIHTISPDKEKRNEESFDSSQPGEYFNKISLQSGLASIRSREQEQLNQLKEHNSARKMKGLFPAHFYRIKYHNYQKKRKYFEELKQQVEEAAEQTIPVPISSNPKNSRKRQSLFLNITKVNKLTNK